MAEAKCTNVYLPSYHLVDFCYFPEKVIFTESVSYDPLCLKSKMSSKSRGKTYKCPVEFRAAQWKYYCNYSLARKIPSFPAFTTENHWSLFIFYTSKMGWYKYVCQKLSHLGPRANNINIHACVLFFALALCMSVFVSVYMYICNNYTDIYIYWHSPIYEYIYIYICMYI